MLNYYDKENEKYEKKSEKKVKEFLIYYRYGLLKKGEKALKKR